MKKWLSLILVLVLMLSLFSGCSKTEDSNDPADGSSSDSNNANSEGNSDNGNAASAITDAEIIISSADATLTLDNFNSSGSIYAQLIPLWTDTLFESDHQGNYTGAVASDWTWSDDYLTLTITVRDGITFTNGEPLTAYDVEFTFNRIIKDLESNTSTSLKAEVADVTATDESTVVFTFNDVCAKFMNSSMTFGILCKSAWEADPDAYWQQPIGSGAYKVVDADFTNSIITFERNDDWWGWDVEGRSTNVKTITYKQISDTTSRLSALRAGEVNYVDGVTLDQVDALRSEGFSVVEYTRDRPYFLFLNCSEGRVFSDINLRKALSMCINRQEIVDYIIGGGEVADWPFSSTMIGYKDGTEGYEYDVDAAKALVDASDYDGSEISFMVSNAVHSRASELATAIMNNAAEVGINLKVELLEQATVSSRRKAGDYDISIAGSPQTYGEGFTLYSNEFSSKDSFHTGYVDQEQFDLIAQASKCIDTEERDLILQDALQHVMDGYAFIFLFQPTEAFAYTSNITGIQVNNDGVHDLRFITVTE